MSLPREVSGDGVREVAKEKVAQFTDRKSLTPDEVGYLEGLLIHYVEVFQLLASAKANSQLATLELHEGYNLDNVQTGTIDDAVDKLDAVLDGIVEEQIEDMRAETQEADA